MSGRETTRRQLLTESTVPLLAGTALNPLLPKGHRAEEGAGRASPGGGAAGTVDVRDFGAVGDGSTDDAPAIAEAVAEASASGSSVFFPKTAASYAVARPLLLNASLSGNGAVIKPASGFSDDALLKSNGGSRLRVRGLVWDADLLPGLQAWGPPDVYGAFGHEFDRCVFKNTAAGVYSLGEDMTVAGNGYTVGSTFSNCLWENCAQALDLRNVQDDVTFIGCRFFFQPGNRATDYQMRLGGQNLLFQGSWYHVADTDFLVEERRPLVWVGSFPVTFRNTFFEAGGESTNCSHVFELGMPSSSFGLENTTARLQGSMPNLVSLIRGHVDSAVSRRTVRTVRVRKVSIPDDRPDYTVMDIGYPTGGGTAEKLSWTHDGLDDYESIGQFDADALLESVPAGALDGIHRGRQLRGEIMPRYGVMSPDPRRTVGDPGEPTFGAGWGHLDSTDRPVSFQRQDGRVRLHGVAVKQDPAPAAGETIFGLPAGHRPNGQKLFEVSTGPSAGAGQVSVESSGAVRWMTAEGGGAAEVFLDQVEFPGEQ